MIKLLLDRFGGNQRGGTKAFERREAGDIECYHVDARFSDGIEDLGVVRLRKVFLVFRYCLEALWCRLRYGVKVFYFAPAPPKVPALLRDLLVMLICRPFFPIIVQHWHAAGLADWLDGRPKAIRLVTRWLMGRPALGIGLGVTNLRDPLWLLAKRIEVVPNGIPDPFPDYERELQPVRQARLAARRLILQREPLPPVLVTAARNEAHIFRILYLGHLFREKGIFETLEGVGLARQALRSSGIPMDIHLAVAGRFASPQDEMEFTRRCGEPDLEGNVTYSGFVAGSEKARLLRESDCLCFPTYYDLESFGLVVLEAMAAGLQVIATRWRALPEILPSDHCGFVPPRDARAIADILPRMMTQDAAALRARFSAGFTDTVHCQRLRDLLSALDPVVVASP